MDNLNDILEAIKTASIQIQHLIAHGDKGKSEQQNSTGDTQLKLDIASDVIIEDIFASVPSIKQIVSEEQDEIKYLHDNGEYLIAYDPLDGSSLVDVNLAVGSIYGIYKNDFNGANIIASVYVVFGPRVEMVVCDGKKVELFRVQSDNSFKYIKDLVLNQTGKINSPGSTQQCWYPHHKAMIEDMFKDGYILSYSGGMVPDLHHILLNGGGLFSYPGATDKPKGKLRQLFEVFPFALIFQTAKGDAIDGQKSLLEVPTTHIHDTAPCFFGSNKEIDIVKKYYAKR